MAAPTSCTAWPPREAIRLLCALSCETLAAVSAVCSTVLASCSIDAAVSSRLLACDSVRADRSRLPRDISAADWVKLRTSVRTSPTTARRLTWVCSNRCMSAPKGCG